MAVRGLALVALLDLAPGTAALRARTPGAGAPGGEGTHGADANGSTKFIFLTHRKTGTNLMQQLCNLSALILSGGREECHWCLRALGQRPDGSLDCPRDFSRDHGELRGTGGRFTLISTITPQEFRRVRKWAPDYLAVSMVREPLQMIVSDYQYNKRLAKTSHWDMTVNASAFGAEFSVEDGLREVSRTLSHVVNHMCGLREATQKDPHVLTLDLAAFEADFDGTTRRLFSFLFGASHPKMEELMKAAVKSDTCRGARGINVSDKSEKPPLDAKIQALLQAGDPAVKAAASCEGARAAASRNGEVRHRGSADPIAAA